MEIRVGDNDDDDDLRFVEEDNFGKVNKFHDLGDNSFPMNWRETNIKSDDTIEYYY